MMRSDEGDSDSLDNSQTGRVDTLRNLIRDHAPLVVVEEYPLTSILTLAVVLGYASTGEIDDGILTGASILYSASLFLANAYLPQGVLTFFNERPTLWVFCLLLIGGTVYIGTTNGWNSVWAGINTIWSELSAFGVATIRGFGTMASRVGGPIRQSGIWSDIFSTTVAKLIVLVLVGLGVVGTIVSYIQNLL